MSEAYESAKRIALGLAKDLDLPFDGGDSLWNIDLGSDFGLKGEIGFQNFEFAFEPPEELEMQKSNLRLFDDEYEEDRQMAEKRLASLKRALAASDKDELNKCLEEVNPEEWLSLIFLDGDQLLDDLVPLLRKASPECRSSMNEALSQALSRLVDFKDLLEALRSQC
jgi:hypothetical protein